MKSRLTISLTLQYSQFEQLDPETRALFAEKVEDAARVELVRQLQR